MLNPNAESRKLADFRACYSEDRADSSGPLWALMQTFMSVLHADLQPVSYLADFPGRVSHHSLHYRCVLNMPAGINKARSRRQKDKLARMNVKHDRKWPERETLCRISTSTSTFLRVFSTFEETCLRNGIKEDKPELPALTREYKNAKNKTCFSCHDSRLSLILWR